ncbi:transmembrane protein [Perilla frutescens var. hirtella]|uniref:Transmembrane protein n=1 Tax=Perilla frutescens var. hirtella TaxID=608512 RepID=A0AAD4J7X2_PERFH|nr:transmembrane protein [Perilla frutescens var. frutescens]KAH6794434.1 transmembrane protein [Perilla frutescens var. hirtella]KAH6819252.1 transmembrane protein [Perilla frutescens var. frutescens]KAH6828853.1 transmembrane protein [Perilla frutescens var. hirtella]
MANQGAKKRKEENIRHMKTLLRLIIASNAIYVVLRMGVFYSSFTWKHWFGLILTSLAYVIPYQQLAAMAKPAYTEDGELLDGGFDMSTGGICGYLHDVIYVTCFVQLSSIISEKFWYIYLVIPGFAAYKLFGLVKGFLPHGSEGDDEDEKTRKKREKMEKRASRTKFVKTRTR